MSSASPAPATAAHRRRYCAFISYRHADNTQDGRRWAEWLHRGLERYTIPPDLIGTTNLRGEAVRDGLYPIFRDEDELPANADLATGIRAALEVSDHLIVLCSPRSAESPWVRKEVREFKELGRSDRILAIIIAGEPNADDPAKAREGIMRDEECFCEELRFGTVREDGTLDWSVRTEPLAADLRPVGTRAEGFVTAEAYREHLTLNSSLPPDKIAARTAAYRQQLDHALIKVIAGLLGVPLGQLVDRDAAHRAALAEKELKRVAAEAQKLRSFTRGIAIAGAAASILALTACWFWWKAREERKETLVQFERAERERHHAESARDAAEQLVTESVHGLRTKLFAFGRLDLAEDMVKAADIYYQKLPKELNTDESERHRASLLLNRAIIATALGKDEEHERFAREALAVTKRLAQKQPERGDLQQESAYAMLNLCTLEHDRADYNAALSLADEVVTRCEDWRRHEPAAAWTFHYEVLAHDLAGQVLARRMGRVPEGMARVVRAMAAAKKLREVAGETADTCEAEGLIHYSEAKVAQKLLAYDRAAASYSAAAASFTKSLELGGDSALLRELQSGSIHHAGMALREVARKEASPSKLKHAEEMVRKAFDLRSKLVALEPAREEWWRDLAWSHDSLADFASAANDNETLLLHRRESVRCRDEAIRRHPGRALLYEERASSRVKLAGALQFQRPPLIKEAAQIVLASFEDWQRCGELSHFQLVNLNCKSAVDRLCQLVPSDRQAADEWLAKAQALVEKEAPKTQGSNDVRTSLLKLLTTRYENAVALGRPQEAADIRTRLEKLTSELAQKSGAMEARDALAKFFEQSAIAAREAKTWALAEEFHKKQLALRKEIALSDPTRPDYFARCLVAHQQTGESLWRRQNVRMRAQSPGTA